MKIGNEWVQIVDITTQTSGTIQVRGTQDIEITTNITSAENEVIRQGGIRFFSTSANIFARCLEQDETADVIVNTISSGGSVTGSGNPFNGGVITEDLTLLSSVDPINKSDLFLRRTWLDGVIKQQSGISQDDNGNYFWSEIHDEGGVLIKNGLFYHMNLATGTDKLQADELVSPTLDLMNNRITALENITTSQGARISFLEGIASALPTLHTKLVATPIAITATAQTLALTEDVNDYGYMADDSKFSILGNDITFKGARKFGYSPIIELENTSNALRIVTVELVRNSDSVALITSTMTIEPRISGAVPNLETFTKYEALTNSVDTTCHWTIKADSTGVNLKSGFVFIDG